jgi:alginate O-acetyltransferase complex protein AlgJ
MNQSFKPSALTRWTNWVLIGLFMGMLWLPGLDSIFHFDWSRTPTENRALNRFPKLPASWHGVQAFVNGLESYFNDHFGCRKCLLQWHNKLRWTLFKDQNTRNVLVGKDGWLFYTQNQMIDHYTGLLQFTPEQLHQWQVLLEKRRDWLAKQGIAYLFVVTPDKHTVYPEYLPDWLIKSKIRSQTKLDQFVAYMHEHSTVPILDQRKVVIDAKHIYPTYFKTDVHWNFFGAFVAYQQLMEALDQLRPGLDKPLPLSDFTVTNWVIPEMTVGGDLAKILGLKMTEHNSYCLFPKSGPAPFTSKIAPPDHPKEPRYTDNPKAKGRMIIFQDSFAMNWLQFLGYHFNNVTYLWQYYFNPAYIEAHKPDIVVTEMNERFFNIADPRKLMEEESLQ